MFYLLLLACFARYLQTDENDDGTLQNTSGYWNEITYSAIKDEINLVNCASARAIMTTK